MLLRHGLALVIFVGLPIALLAQESGSWLKGAKKYVQESEGSVSMRLGYYNNEDNIVGNPFIDEKLSVVEAAVAFDFSHKPGAVWFGQFSYDLVSSASIARLGRFEEQSGASGNVYFGLVGGTTRDIDENSRWTGQLSASKEYDYTSTGWGFAYGLDLNDKNTVLGANFSANYDFIAKIRFDGRGGGLANRNSHSASLSWYQMLNSSLHSSLGLAYTHQNGFLQTNYNEVVIEDATLAPNPFLHNQARGYSVTEELPSTRDRLTVHGHLGQRLPTGTALHLKQRYYSDSWGLWGYGLEPQVNQWIVPDLLSARASFRYYEQFAADYYSPHFNQVVPFRTQDPDLAKFIVRDTGLQLVLETMGPTYDFSLHYVTRSDGIDQWIATSGAVVDF